MTSPTGRESRPIRSTSGEMGWWSGKPEGARATTHSRRSWRGAIRSRRSRNGSRSAPLALCLEAEVREAGVGREREGCRDPAVERGLVQDAMPGHGQPKLLFRRAAAPQAVDACLAGPDRAQRSATATRKLPVRNGFVRSGPVHHVRYGEQNANDARRAGLRRRGGNKYHDQFLQRQLIVARL